MIKSFETFELDIEKGGCLECTYSHHCHQLKYPGLNDNTKKFYDFCKEHLEFFERPEIGTLEKNLPDIFPLSSEEAIKLFCSKVCIMECNLNCPLYEFKKKIS